jgi:aspartate carbamoyltransferase catalytic subunit
VVTVKATGSSIDKGESLKDTIATLGAYGPEAIVIRSPHAGAAELVARWRESGSGSSATCCTAASPAPTRSPSAPWGPR